VCSKKIPHWIWLGPDEDPEPSIDKAARNNANVARMLVGVTVLLVIAMTVGVWQNSCQFDDQMDKQDKALINQENELVRFGKQLDINQKIFDNYYRPWVGISINSITPDYTNR